MYSLESIDSTNRIFNGTFDKDISGWNCASNHNNCEILWDSNKLDSGCLRLGFTDLSGEPGAYLHGIKEFGETSNGDDYLLKFSMISSVSDRTVKVSMLKATSPYNRISKEKSVSVGNSRQEYELLITSLSNESNARIDFIIDEDNYFYWLDNVELYKAFITITHTIDSVFLFFNPSMKELSIIDGNYYIDARGNKFHNFKLQPYNSLVLLKVPPDFFEESEENVHEKFLILFPNPAKHLINLITNEGNEKLIRIIDMSGKVVHEELSPLAFISIDVSSFVKGIYIVKVKADNSIISSQIVVL